MRQAKKAGKLRNDYQIPEKFRSNYPEIIIEKISALKAKGYFPPFPFGTDFTEQAHREVTGTSWRG
jgi:hypothetical protein